MIRERLAGRAHDADLLVQPVLRERDSTGPAAEELGAPVPSLPDRV